MRKLTVISKIVHVLASRKEHKKGSALIAALWVSIALSVLIGSMIFSARTDIALVKTAKESAQTQAILEGAINLAHATLPRVRHHIGREGPEIKQDYIIGGTSVQVIITDEGGRIDFNAAPEGFLRLFFERAGATDPDSLTAAVLDWRDRNDIKRLNGAENRDYTAQGRTYGPGNGPFTTLQEVKGLLGMFPDFFEKIAPHITLTSQQRGFDPDLASPEFIELLLGGTSSTNPNALPLAIQNYRTRSRRKVFRLVATLNREQQAKMVRVIKIK